MKFAICNETFLDWPFPKAFAFAAECGYTGVEIAPFTIAASVADISPARRAEICRQADLAGLEVIGLHWLLAKTSGLHLTSSDAEVRRRTAGTLGDLTRLCADLGGKILVFGSPQQRSFPPEMDRRQAFQNAAEVFSAILPTLEECDVTLALEPLTPQETNFLNTAAEAVELAEQIGSPHVRLHLDCKAMSSETASQADLIRQYRSVMAHLHVNDPNRQGPGFGELDFVPILQALGHIDYRGWVSVEVFDYTPGVERLARESIEYLHATLDAALKAEG